MIDKIISIFKSDAVKQVGTIMDDLTTGDEEKSQAKKMLSQVVFNALDGVVKAQASVIQTEMKGSWLQRSWRPMTILTFVALLVIRWTGLSDYHVPPELELELMSIIKISLGGYVIGRSTEKIASTVTKNIDMSFLKKKDRKL